MSWTVFRISFLVVVLIPLASFLYLRAAEEKPPSLPLTTTERLALASLNERGRMLQEDTRAFSTEVCNSRGIKMEECSIDPTGMTVSRVIKSPAPAK